MFFSYQKSLTPPNVIQIIPMKNKKNEPHILLIMISAFLSRNRILADNGIYPIWINFTYQQITLNEYLVVKRT